MTHQTQLNTGGHPRNTKATSSQGGALRGRGWTFTIFTEITEWIPKLKTFECEVIGFQTENAPTTGTEHIQGFIYYKNAKALSAMKKLFPGIHIEKMKKVLQANVNYCTTNSGKSYEKWNKKARYLRRSENVLIDIDNGIENNEIIVPQRPKFRMAQKLALKIEKDEELKFWFKKLFLNESGLMDYRL